MVIYVVNVNIAERRSFGLIIIICVHVYSHAHTALADKLDPIRPKQLSAVCTYKSPCPIVFHVCVYSCSNHCAAVDGAVKALNSFQRFLQELSWPDSFAHTLDHKVAEICASRCKDAANKYVYV